MRNILWILGALIILVGGYFGLKNFDDSNFNVGRDVPEDWKEYRDENMGFVLHHPEHIEMEDQGPNLLQFRYLGPTQRSGTEVYDGLIINVRQESYEEGSLRSHVESRIDQETEEGMVELIEPVREVSLGSIDALYYSMQGLGVFDHYVVDSNNNNYLSFSVLVADPDDRGYQETVNQILSTLELL